jgi:N-acetylglucosaminyldiphosphoundecaprenol N-acetyl-beta-D-mannosaminyltransferase
VEYTVSSDVVVEGLTINALPLDDTAALICRDAGSKAARNVFTLNLDHIVKMRKDPTFKRAYKRVGLITADGFPVALACRLQGKRITRVAGSDLIAPISAEAARSGKSIYLFGSSSHVLVKASRLLSERYAELKIAGILAPPQGFDPISEEARHCILKIGHSGAHLCFVALGAPKQELFADHGKSFLPNISFICIGAGLDFIAGTQVRAPYWMQRCGLEWLWRAAGNPRRLFYRYFLCVIALPGVLARAALATRQR